MKTIEFKSKGLLYILYSMFYTSDAKDTCQYRGGLIISIITAIVAPWAVIVYFIFMIPSIRPSRSDQGIRLLLLSFILAITTTAVGIGFLERLYDIIHWHELTGMEVYFNAFIPFIIGVSLVIISGSIVSGLIWVIWKAFGLIPWPTVKLPRLLNKNTGKPINQIGVIYLSWKEKWCNKITWL